MVDWIGAEILHEDDDAQYTEIEVMVECVIPVVEFDEMVWIDDVDIGDDVLGDDIIDYEYLQK